VEQQRDGQVLLTTGFQQGNETHLIVAAALDAFGNELAADANSAVFAGFGAAALLSRRGRRH